MKTWEENRSVINQLWPAYKMTEEERRLWTEDLSGLKDQDVLYDAIRNARRSHDSEWPQLKWVHDEYRALFSSRKAAMKAPRPKEKKLEINVDQSENDRLSADFTSVIDAASPSEFDSIEAMVLEKVPKMHAASALRVLNYARLRLLNQGEQFGRVTSDGDVQPIKIGGVR